MFFVPDELTQEDDDDDEEEVVVVFTGENRGGSAQHATRGRRK